MCVSRKVPTTQCQSVFSTRSLNFLFVDRGITWVRLAVGQMFINWIAICDIGLTACCSCCNNPRLTHKTFSSSSQPSLLSAEPLLPPHNFHSHSLRRLPLYQPLHISSPMPASLSVGQPTLPPLPAHRRVPLAGAPLSPTQVPPFLSLPRRQPSYALDQVCFIVVLWLLASPWMIHSFINKVRVSNMLFLSFFYSENHSTRPQTLSEWMLNLQVHFWTTGIICIDFKSTI